MLESFNEKDAKQQYEEINKQLNDLETNILEITKTNKEEFITLSYEKKREIQAKLSLILLICNEIIDLIYASKLSREIKLELLRTLSEKTKSYKRGKTRN